MKFKSLLFFSAKNVLRVEIFVFLRPNFKTKNYVRNFRTSTIYNCRKAQH